MTWKQAILGGGRAGKESPVMRLWSRDPNYVEEPAMLMSGGRELQAGGTANAGNYLASLRNMRREARNTAKRSQTM